MRPELNQQLKERFFAQYWGQKVFDYAVSMINHPVRISPDFAREVEAWAVLRSIDQLTDEENIEIAKIFNQHVIKKHYETDDLKAYLIMKGHGYALRVDHFLTVADYMRSIGVAAPFMGYSVEELCEAGWVRLKEAEIPSDQITVK